MENPRIAAMHKAMSIVQLAADEITDNFRNGRFAGDISDAIHEQCISACHCISDCHVLVYGLLDAEDPITAGLEPKSFREVLVAQAYNNLRQAIEARLPTDVQ